MNIELETQQQELAAAIRGQVRRLPVHSSGWEVLNNLGFIDLLTDEAAVGFGQIEWCLLFEELGAGVRDTTTTERVRTFIDVYCSPNGKADKSARRALRDWAEASPAEPLLACRSADLSADGGAVWSTQHSVVASVAALPSVALDANQDQRVTDRELLVRAAYAIGIARRSLEIGHQRAVEREVGGRRLLEQQSTAHRLARGAVTTAAARLEVWEAAWWEDTRGPAGYRTSSAAAAAVSAAVACTHESVQIFGAAGTSDGEVVRLYRAAYDVTERCGPPSLLWHAAASRQRPVNESGADTCWAS